MVECEGLVEALPLFEERGNERKEDRLLREIGRDVERTFGGLAWFSGQVPAGGKEDKFWKRIEDVERADMERAISRRNTPSPIPPLPPSTSPLSTSTSSSTLLPAPSTEVRVTPPTPTSPSSSNPFTSRPKPHTRRESLLRPLFIHATLNPGVSYVQGMHSLLAVLFYIFSSSPSTLTEEEAEACSFFALGKVLSQLRDIFSPSLDGTISPSSPRLTGGHRSQQSIPLITPTGLGATLQRFSSLLNWVDPTLSASLESKSITPQLYVFKWLTTLFSSEFSLPDLVLVWDRLISLFPDDNDEEEALSPLLSHAIDISISIVIWEKSIVRSPYSSFEVIVKTLQNPRIEGEQVGALLKMAWEIRERRLGKKRVGQKRESTDSVGSSWGKWAASKWSGGEKGSATSPSPATTAASLKNRLWAATAVASPDKRSSISSSSSIQGHGRTDSTSGTEYDLEDCASVAESEGSNHPPLFASRGQRIGVIVEGKVLPPGPDEIDERERRLGQLPPPPSVDEEEEEEESEDGEIEYDSDDPDGEASGPSLRDRWGTLVTRIAASDAAASLAKTTTNLSIKASLSADKFNSSDAAASLAKTTTNISAQAALLRAHAPETLARLRENVGHVGERLMASTSGSGGYIEGLAPPRRPGSPTEEPFTPPRSTWPTLTDTPGPLRRPVSPAPFSTQDGFSSPTNSSVDMSRGSSGSGHNGPKPLLLSSSARPGRGSGDPMTLPPESGRESLRSPSPSRSPSFGRTGPTLWSDAPVAPLGHVRGPSSATRLPAGSFGGVRSSPTTITPSAADFADRFADPDIPINRYFSSSTSSIPQQHQQQSSVDDIPQSRLRRSVQNRKETSSSSSSISAAIPAPNGRGWSLSDAPMKKPQTPQPLSLDLSFTSQSRTQAFASPEVSDEERPRSKSPSKRDSVTATAVPLPFSPVEEEDDRPVSPIGRSKVVRRPAAVKKRLGRSGTSGSVSSLGEVEHTLIEREREQRRSVSAFLSGEGGFFDDARSVGSGGSLRQKVSTRGREKSSNGNGLGGTPVKQEQAEEDYNWDDAAQILEAYGE